ncbi:MAG TPA: PilZ domain-containing protein [Candidatus Sulfotelmatobacter sp.]|nr:PilZ domain-containing protein [Candidatus Sulfotelmatobacter sp.]
MKALVVSNDAEMVTVFSSVLGKKCIGTVTCAAESAAKDQLSSDKFEVLILDFDNVSGYERIIRGLGDPNRHGLVIAVASENGRKETALKLGASVVIERPLDPVRILELFRCSYGRILRDSQAYFRLAAELPVWIRRGSGSVVQCITFNLSQRGMAVRAPCVFKVDEPVNIGFAIPNTDFFVGAEGRVIWDDKHGQAGISFECTNASIQLRFFEWLHDHFLMTVEPHISPSGTPESAHYVSGHAQSESLGALPPGRRLCEGDGVATNGECEALQSGPAALAPVNEQMLSAHPCRLAHDLNNYVGVILGRTQLLAENCSSYQEMLTHCSHIIVATRKIATLIKDSRCSDRSVK